MPTDLILQYKYRFNEIYLMRGEEVLRLNWANIQSFTIQKNYDGFVRPSYLLTMQVDNKTNLWMSRHQSDFQVYLDIQKVTMDISGNQVGPAQQFMKGMFIGINPTSSSVSIERLQDAWGNVMDTSDVNDLTEMIPNATVTIGLLQREMFNCSMVPANTIVERDNLQNIVMALLTKAGFKKLLMCPFQNYTVYEDILIPALPLYEAINYLDYKYGFYKAGAIIFYDYDTVYIIDSSMKHLVYTEGEDPHITLNIFDVTKEVTTGHVAGNNKRELYVSNATTNLLMGEDLQTATASTMTVVNVNDGSKSHASYPTQNQNPLTSQRVVYGSDQVAEYIQQRQLENKVRMTISGYHYDIDSFTPNSITSVYHSNAAIQKQIAGSYRISNLICEIENRGDNFEANTAVSYLYCGR